MNFFQHQDQARRRTGLLVLLFALAVASLIALTNILVLVFALYASNGDLSESLVNTEVVPLDSLLSVSLGVLSIIALASLFKLIQLSRGGRAVAEALGGKKINPNTDDPDERRVRNVVEEMAIAAGIPVPPVYLFEEQGINAFAAGYQTGDAVIGVSRGCINLLDRDELQGVIAHEFSHILHGDMRLNIRLMGVLHGILVIGIIGYYLLRIVSRVGYRRRSGKNDLALPLLLLGGGLAIIGYAGTFFGNLIKAAVSRQREYLADASAVRYTRNPAGIGGALKKIGGFVKGSHLEHPKAAEMSHLFFAQAISHFLGSLMATHPPLTERIRRIDPNWNGQYPHVAQQPPKTILMRDAGQPGVSPVVAGQVSTSNIPEQPKVEDVLLASVGELAADQLSYATNLLTSIPAAVMDAAHDPFSARALIYCLLLDRRPAIELKQWQQLESTADARVFAEMCRLNSPEIRMPRFRLPILELCLPALAQLSDKQYRIFKSNLIHLIKADQAVELFEWAVYRIIIQYIEPDNGLVFGRRQIKSLKSVGKATELLLSAVAAAGADSPDKAMESFNRAKEMLGLRRIQFVSQSGHQSDYSLRDLSRALAILNRLRPLVKPKLLKALCQCVTYDGKVKPIEMELLRAISISLDCPMPPVVDTAFVST